jgi:hypothetical protein
MIFDSIPIILAAGLLFVFHLGFSHDFIRKMGKQAETGAMSEIELGEKATYNNSPRPPKKESLDYNKLQCRAM